MYQLLFYDLVEDYLARRAPLRDAHLGLVRDAHARGELVLAGAFGDPVEGALLVFRGPDPTIPERFVAADPYVLQGLVAAWRVRPWNQVVVEE